jgi:hypothetical protein
VPRATDFDLPGLVPVFFAVTDMRVNLGAFARFDVLAGPHR